MLNCGGGGAPGADLVSFEFGFDGEKSGGPAEEVVWSEAIDFDLLVPAIVMVRAHLAALTKQIGGGNGVYRLRLDGTLDGAGNDAFPPDGAIIATLNTTHAVYVLPVDGVDGIAFARPIGRHYLKLTVENDTAPNLSRLRACQIVISEA